MTRKKAIKVLKETYCGNRAFCELFRTDHCRKTDCEIYHAVKALEAEPRWIPVTEKMPTIDARVLVTTSWGLVETAYRCVDYWEIGGYSYKPTSVIAWMPLPEPYRKVVKNEAN